MVKLIASDIDGTLMTYGQTQLPPAIFPLIHRLRERGILFCPASGRQYHSLRTLFAPVADEVCFLCENGAILYGPGTEDSAPVLSKTVMPREAALALAEAILDLPGCDLLVSGANTSYVCACPPEYIRYMEAEKGNRVTLLPRPQDIPEDIIKVSAYCPGGTAAPQEALGPRWGESLRMAAAGPDWVDFTLADKGGGLKGLCAGLGVALADTMAFGDNWNDLPMLDLAGTAWIMETAEAALRSRYPHHCQSVLPVLEALLKELEL